MYGSPVWWVGFVTNELGMNCRYPDDPSDRIWSSDESYFSPLTATAIDTTSNLLVSQVYDQAPAAVLGSARVNYQNQSLTYALPLPSDLQTLRSFEFNVYFSELFNSSASFNLSVDNNFLLPQITLRPFVAVEYMYHEYSEGAWWNLTLQPMSGAPLINALEVFSPIPVNSTVTVSNDGELSRF
jgi:hypothetical protein